MERIHYDEMAFFAENAAEFGLPFDDEPTVARHQVELDDGRVLSALVWGQGDPEIVLLHGGAQNAHTWDTVALALRPRPLVAIDLPGHGHSDRAVGSGPRAAAADVAVAVERLAPRAAGLVGMSFGGLTAVAVAATAPELVQRLVLVDVMPGLDAQRARHIVDFVQGPPTFPSFEELLARTKEFNPTRSESSLRRGILHNALQLDDGSWVWRHQRWRLEQDASEVDQPVEQAGGADKPDERDQVQAELIDDLAQLSMPLMLARGMRSSSVLGDADEARLLELHPQATIRRFDQAGHSIQGDMPVELAAAIDEFIR